MKRFIRENGLTLALTGMFLVTWLIGQTVTGFHEYNDDRQQHQQTEVGLGQYLTSPHFLEATMENWESEFLQMFIYVVLTAFLYQKGSAESKDPDGKEAVDDDPQAARNQPGAPWPVRKGGWILKLYSNSLSLAFLLLFLMAFWLHAVGGAELYNEEQLYHGQTELMTAVQFMTTSQFWFQSFQNWQSEFLSMAAMVVLTIFLRQKGSPESKPVAAPHGETG